MLEQKAATTSSTFSSSNAVKSPVAPSELARRDEVEATPLAVSEAFPGSTVDRLPNDALVYIFSWLKMGDMISVSQVNTRWRQIASSTASLWWDVQLGDPRVGAVERFVKIASRTKILPINVTISMERTFVHEWRKQIKPKDLRAAARLVLQLHGHQIISLEINPQTVCCDTMDCPLAWVPSFRHAVKLGREAGMRHQPTWWCAKKSYALFPDVRVMHSVELHRGFLPCSLLFPTVKELRLLDFPSVTWASIDLVAARFPNVTSLSITANAAPYFGERNVLAHFLDRLSRVDHLSISTKMVGSQSACIINVLRWPLRTIELDVSASGNGFARLARTILRELLTADSVLTFHSTRKRNAAGNWEPKYSITLHVSWSGGRNFIFTHESFGRVLQNYAAPLLREEQVREIVINGHAAFEMLYAACGVDYHAHITTLRIIVCDSDSLRLPRQPLLLRGLQEVILEQKPEHGSCISAALVVELLSKLDVGKRVSLRIKNVFVYGDAMTSGIERYADLIEGVVRPPSWHHVSATV